ncbi:MAG: chromate efflux transporter [Verrucomicrobia bacterium]|nr:chromate efflux transporter [Verrucomicrobiota bacterium]
MGTSDPAPVGQKPSFREALRFWLKLGFISFGGPAGQIAIMQAELVERKKWIGQERFLHALNFCMLLPGPEAQQLAIYCGWLLHRTWGGIVAGVLFVLPSAFMLWGLSYLYVLHADWPVLAAFLTGLKPAVVSVVIAAVLRIGAKALKTPANRVIAATAFGLIFGLGVGFPWIVAGALVLGWLGSRFWPTRFTLRQEHRAGKNLTASEEREAISDLAQSDGVAPSWARARRVTAVCGVLWIAPVVAAAWIFGPHSTLVAQGGFFSRAAMVTFGGAYAVLPYVAQQAVETHGWLSGTQMLDGLAFAETTPGPLIMVLQFVGFMGGWAHPDAGLSPLAAATLGAAMTTWVTFVPCFLWIFLGAPYIERLRGNKALGAALSAVTAAVVGVILNLAVWFAGQVWHPAGSGWNGFALAVSVLAFVALHRFKANLIVVLAVSGAAGVLWAWLVF